MSRTIIREGAAALREATRKAGDVADAARLTSDIYQNTVVRPLPNLSKQGARDFAVPPADASVVAKGATQPSTLRTRLVTLAQKRKEAEAARVPVAPPVIVSEASRGGTGNKKPTLGGSSLG